MYITTHNNSYIILFTITILLVVIFVYIPLHDVFLSIKEDNTMFY